MPKVYGLSDSLWKRGFSAREACLNGGRGLCLVVAADRVRGGVSVCVGWGGRRANLSAWTTLDAQWLHSRGCGCSDLGSCGPQATMGWGPSLASPVPLGSAPFGTLTPPKCALPLGVAAASFPAPQALSHLLLLPVAIVLVLKGKVQVPRPGTWEPS